MQIHDLKHKNFRGKRRIGRGGKKGTYSGRGQKGQKARAGRKIRPGLRDTLLRLPKKRGFRNKPKGDRFFVLNLDQIGRLSEEKITRELLVAKGLVPKREKNVKILGRGSLKEGKGIFGIKVSSSAKLKIEKAGGKVGK